MKMQHLHRWIVLLFCLGSAHWSALAEPAHDEPPTPPAKASAGATPVADHAAASTESGKPPPLIDLKKAIREQMLGNKKITLVVSDKPTPAASAQTPTAKDKVTAAAKDPIHAAPTHTPEPAVKPTLAHPVANAAKPRSAPPTIVINPRASRDYIRARAAALTGQATTEHDNTSATHESPHWSYEGATGPQAWGQLQPEFATCATGQRQSPINIEDSYTLQGPAEPLQFNYTPSNGTVVNNGHTIQVNVQGNNTLMVRGSVYSLLQIHFHSPSEEQVNYRRFAMVAHLVHKNTEDQLAVVAVLLDPGEANALIDKIWTYMPLDVNDQVRMPPSLLNLSELLPQDQRYYQFFGSLTTPPCTEGVLWMVLKQPVPISAAQLRLFQQLYPNNARPIQAVNNRPVRNAQ